MIMLLVFPPLAKACEPPAGIAQLAGSLRAQGLPCHLIDANIEGMLYLLTSPAGHSRAIPGVRDTTSIRSAAGQEDNWTRRARRHCADNLADLRKPALYANLARYRRRVADVNRLLEVAGRSHGLNLSLANYGDPQLSPQKSTDLLQAAATPEKNIFFPYFAPRLTQAVEASSPAAVGFSLNYLSQALCTFAMAGFLKQRFPTLTIVLGGGLVTSWLSNPSWHNPFGGLIDHIIAGPGEEALLTLLGGKKGGGATVVPSFRDLPMPDYLAPGPILPLAASSGCYWNRCAFCPERAEKNPYLPRTSESVFSDIHAGMEEVNPVLIHFLDNAISPALLRALAANPPGVPWYGFARIGPELADPDFCQTLRAAGCVMLKLGLESGAQDVLNRMNKGVDLTTVSLALRSLRAAGIATYVYLLFGTPWENPDEAGQTLDFVINHQDGIGFLNLALFNLPICSEEARQIETLPFYEGDLALYADFIHPQGWNRKEVRHFLDREVRRHPAIAAILRRDPPFFTSNHAPLLPSQQGLFGL